MTSSDPGWDLAQTVSRIERRLLRRLASVLDGVCTVEEWRALSLLSDGRGHPMSEIAEHVMLPPPSTTKLIDRMVSDNRVYRRADPNDRRRVLAFLTVRGRELSQRLRTEVARDQDRLLTAMADRGTLDELLGSLDRCLAAEPSAPPRRSAPRG